MKPKTLILLAVAAGCGLVAMFGVQQAINGQGSPVQVPTVKVLVAIENIDTGVQLTSANTKFKELPINVVNDDAVKLESEYEKRAAKIPIVAGDIVRASKLTLPGEFGQSINIPPGMRVISIAVTDAHTNSGLVKPKDRVDVLVTFQTQKERSTVKVSRTKTLLEYVEVFSCDGVTADNFDDKAQSNKAKNISLLLTPEQTNYVILAQSKGILSLSWRRRGDDEMAQTREINEKLLEELEGTVGLYDDGMPLYSRTDDDPFSSSNDVGKFLDDAAGEPSVVTNVPAVPVVPAKPKWEVVIYNRTSATRQNFDIE